MASERIAMDCKDTGDERKQGLFSSTSKNKKRFALSLSDSPLFPSTFITQGIIHELIEGMGWTFLPLHPIFFLFFFFFFFAPKVHEVENVM